MVGTALEKEDHRRDADFNKAMHGKSAQATGGVAAMFSKDKAAKQAAMDEYFKHFDNKKAAEETAADREVRPQDISRSSQRRLPLGEELRSPANRSSPDTRLAQRNTQR